MNIKIVSASVAAGWIFSSSAVFATPGIPESIRPCLSQTNGANVEMLATTQSGGKTYFLLGATGPEEFSYWQPLVEQESNQCKLLSSKQAPSAPASRYIPLPFAKQLALQTLQKSIQKAGGRAKLQAMLLENDDPDGGPGSFAPETIWAYKKLGFRLPANYKINR